MPPDGIRFRPSAPQDCEVILHHRRCMFRDMKSGTDAELDAVVEDCRPWLEKALADHSYRGWLAEDSNGKVVAGGGLLITSWPPRPRDQNARRAVVFNVYTEPEFRNKGVARELMLLMIGWLREHGFRSVALHASDEGRHLYESLGFVATNEMRLDLS
jgi:GNAT superfamily N-acetyltransferase